MLLGTQTGSAGVGGSIGPWTVDAPQEPAAMLACRATNPWRRGKENLVVVVDDARGSTLVGDDGLPTCPSGGAR